MKIRVLFICHGNICRSPMAEYIFKKMIKDEGIEDDFVVSSAATSYEEYGNPVYPPVKKLLRGIGINCDAHRACRMDKEDYDKYDMLICMDSRNLRNLRNIIGDDPEHKVHLLMEFTGKPKDVEDPYYSGDYEAAWKDINEGCEALLNGLKYKSHRQRG